MNKPILKISYDAFASNFEVEDFTHIEDFKSDLSKEYGYFIKPRPVGRGGGAYELAVEFLLNVDLKTYLDVIGGYLGGKLVDKIVEPKLDQYLFKPFFSIFKSFSEKHGGVEICEFKIELYNSTIIIYKIVDVSIVDVFEQILETIYQKLEKIVLDDEFPSEFTIPVFSDVIKDKGIFRPPLGVDETIDQFALEDYFKLWRLNYEFIHGEKIYDLVNDQLIDDVEFLTEDEYFRKMHE